MSKKSAAWLLDFGAGIQAAVAENESVEYLISPRIYPVPVTPSYCSSVVFWRDLQLPLFNMVLLTQPEFDVKTEHLCVLAYQTEAKTPLNYIGVALVAPPEKILISDDDACDWPDDFPEIWKTLTLAMFTRKEKCTPILDIVSLCDGSAGF